ncbi:MAG: enoyl-CoA hydratase/isomerase family protein [Luteimonas sp.]|nr:enoyl-CoA hydratase/isomerase family protein [Luteimonas sp.]
MTALIVSTDHGPIRELTLARPPVNALNPALCSALREAVEQAVAAGVEGLVLAGGPKVFSAGLDVPHLLTIEDRGALLAAWESFFGAARALAQCPVPVVAAIAGHAPAGGCVLALCCDYRVMASGPFRIGLNETQVGLAAPLGVMRLMQRVVGQHRAERLLVSGELVDAERALAIGLVDELADIDHVALRARVWLEELLKLPRKPMLDTRAAARADLVAAMGPESIQLDRFIAAWSEPDTQAGLRALVAKLGK